MINFLRKYGTVKNIIFSIIAVLFLIFLTKIKDIAILFFASFVISCSLNPIVDKLEQKKMKRSLASTLVLCGSLLIFTMFLIPIVITGVHQIQSFGQILPGHFENIKNIINTSPLIQNTELNQFNISELMKSATDFTSQLLSQSITFSKEVASVLIYFLAACLIIYYFMADKDLVRKTYMSFFPKQMKNKAEEIIETISQKIGGYVIAQVITMVSVGIIVMLGLLILRIDYALLLGLITAIFDLIPVIGPALALVIILVSIHKSGWLTIGLVILVFAFAQWAENNLVRPYIFSKFLNLHPLVIYFFLLITAQYLGIIGVIFAPAIAATVCVLVEELYIKNVN